MSRPHLVVVPDQGLHDLPPRWDGHAVHWVGWSPPDLLFFCPPLPGGGCESCGSLAPQPTNRGLVASDPAMSPADVEADDQATRLAFGSGGRRERKAWLKLMAFRCPDCGADTVVDDKDEVWSLDQSDYGDRGSMPPAEEARP